MKLWLSRESSGHYTLSVFKPIKLHVYGTDKEELYLVPGESFGVRHLCPRGTFAVFGVKINRLESVEVELHGQFIPPKAA